MEDYRAVVGWIDGEQPICAACLRRGKLGGEMYPSAVAKQAEIQAAIDEVERSLAPEVVHIRYEIGEDWSGQWAIFFRVVLTDDAAKGRLRDVATKVVWGLSQRLDFPALGVFPYHNFRSVSEQAALQEPAWA
jgi:hypothetical protein